MIERPKIRPIEAFPVEHDGQTLICLRDPAGIAPAPVVLGLGAYFLVMLFDGANAIIDIQAAFMRRFGEIITSERLRELIDSLDRAFLLDSPACAVRMQQIKNAFAGCSERPAAYAGLCYADDLKDLRPELDSYRSAPAGPNAVHGDGRGLMLRGVIAPHIDPRRGGPAYSRAYAEIAAHQRPELVIILGTSHYGMGPELFSVTSKDYATPFGAVTTDRAFVERLAAQYRNGDLFADELLHRNEHSIEFQVLFLAHELGLSGYEIVPILISSFHQIEASDKTPASEPRVQGFIDALAEEIAAERRRVLIIAGVDLAHVGRKFGDEFAVDADVALRLRRDDLEMVEYIKHGDAAGFFNNIADDHDRRRICGMAPIYTQLRLLEGHAARLLMYDIAMEPQTGSAVSFASLTIE